MHEKRPTSVLAYASYRNNLYYNINTKSDVDSLTKISRLVSRTKKVDISVFQLPFVLIKNHIICISNDNLIKSPTLCVAVEFIIDVKFHKCYLQNQCHYRQRKKFLFFSSTSALYSYYILLLYIYKYIK